MNAALFVQDKELKGNDYLFYNGSSLSQDNPLREKVFSKLAFPRGHQVFKSDSLEIYSGLNSINISTYLTDDYVDIRNRRIPIMFFISGLKFKDVCQTLVQYLDIYGGKIDPVILDGIKETIEKHRKRRKMVLLSIVIIILMLLILI